MVPGLDMDRKKNSYFINRIKAGAELYKAGKVDCLVGSGGDYRKSDKHLNKS